MLIFVLAFYGSLAFPLWNEKNLLFHFRLDRGTTLAWGSLNALFKEGQMLSKLLWITKKSFLPHPQPTPCTRITWCVTRPWLCLTVKRLFWKLPFFLWSISGRKNPHKIYVPEWRKIKNWPQENREMGESWTHPSPALSKGIWWFSRPDYGWGLSLLLTTSFSTFSVSGSPGTILTLRRWSW